MAKLLWDQVGTRTYETGIDHGVLYPQKDGKYENGVAWSGLTTITESPSGAEDSAFYADNMKYFNLKSAEELGLTLECYTYPPEWDECNGEAKIADGVSLTMQTRNSFGLSYRTKFGNDTKGEDYGYKLHLVYGCSATPSEKAYNTTNDSPDAIAFSFSISTISVPVTGYKPTALIVINSTKVDVAKLKDLEDILYGTDTAEPRLPLPDEVVALFAKG